MGIISAQALHVNIKTKSKMLTGRNYQQPSPSTKPLNHSKKSSSDKELKISCLIKGEELRDSNWLFNGFVLVIIDLVNTRWFTISIKNWYTGRNKWEKNSANNA